MEPARCRRASPPKPERRSPILQRPSQLRRTLLRVARERVSRKAVSEERPAEIRSANEAVSITSRIGRAGVKFLRNRVREMRQDKANRILANRFLAARSLAVRCPLYQPPEALCRFCFETYATPFGNCGRVPYSRLPRW